QGRPPAAAAPAGEEADEADPFESEEVWQDKAGRWRTTFPPPEGFEGDEEGVWNGVDWYSRSLDPREQAAVEALLARADETAAQERARECGRRDRFFGFAGGENSSFREAEPYATSEPSGPAQGPIEYKSLVPPSPTGELPRSGIATL
ncbi:MAG TPA: hypothetical protein VFZ91_12035, partial [Allosphingosinicella sp.]